MSTADFVLYIAKDQSSNVSLETELKIRQIIERLCLEYELPLKDAQRPLEYILFNHSQSRVLAREQSLTQAGSRSGDTLYLGLRASPWWEERDRPEDPRPTLWGRLPFGPNQLGFGVAALVLITFLVVPFVMAQPRDSGPQPPRNTTAPTPTLVEEPTIEVQVFASTNSTSEPTPTLAPQVTDTPAATATPAQTPTAAALRDAVVRGVKAAYRSARPAYFFSQGDIFGAHLWAEPALSTALPATRGSLLLSNNDQVAILDDSVGGVYRVRVLSNKLDPDDQRVINTEGWIARWLIDDEGVPPTPTPRPAPPTAVPATRSRFSPQVTQSYPSSANSGQRASCVQGRVIDRSGAGIPAAGLIVNNGVSTTGIIADGGGNFKLCGLGYSQWALALRFVPKTNGSSENALRSDIVQNFFVNGSSAQAVIINFVEVR